jgi:hypothetical protein
LGVVTVTSTVPLPAGLVAMIWVSLTTVNLLAAVCPKETLVAPVKPVPLIVTSVPPVLGPLVGLMPVIVGNGKGDRPGVGDGNGKGDRPIVGVGKGDRPGAGGLVGVGKDVKPSGGAEDVGVGEGIGDIADDPDEFGLPQETNIMQVIMMIMSKIVALNHLSDTLYLLNEAYNMCSSIQINQSEYALNNKAYLISNQFKLLWYSV